MAKQVEHWEITALKRAIDELGTRWSASTDGLEGKPPVSVRQIKQQDRMQSMADNFLKYNKPKGLMRQTDERFKKYNK